jgi:hypothetical protein
MTDAETWTVSSTCAWVEVPVENDVAVMSFAENRPITLSPVGALIWGVLVQDRTSDESLLEPPLTPLSTEEIVAEVAARVGEHPETVTAGVTSFLEQLEDAGILTRTRA